MTVLVTGAAGMLGSGLVLALQRAGHVVVPTDIDLDDRRPWGHAAPSVRPLDVRNHDAVRRAVTAVQPDLVVHLAAITDLEACEVDPDRAWETNTLGTKYVALACRDVGAAIAYVSTAGVFDGTSDLPYTEFDVPSPVNVYGRSKLEGEAIVQQLVDQHYVLRAGWMVGGGARDHKFVAKVLAKLHAGVTRIHAVVDKVGTPTYVPDFARCFTDLVATRLYGRYHMVCEGAGTRLDVCRTILEALDRDDVEVVPVDSSFFGDEFFAERPASEVLRNLVLDLQGMNTMRPWQVALREYVVRHHAEIGCGVRPPVAAGRGGLATRPGVAVH